MRMGLMGWTDQQAAGYVKRYYIEPVREHASERDGNRSAQLSRMLDEDVRALKQSPVCDAGRRFHVAVLIAHGELRDYARADAAWQVLFDSRWLTSDLYAYRLRRAARRAKFGPMLRVREEMARFGSLPDTQPVHEAFLDFFARLRDKRRIAGTLHAMEESGCPTRGPQASPAVTRALINLHPDVPSAKRELLSRGIPLTEGAYVHFMRSFCRNDPNGMAELAREMRAEVLRGGPLPGVVYRCLAIAAAGVGDVRMVADLFSHGASAAAVRTREGYATYLAALAARGHLTPLRAGAVASQAVGVYQDATMRGLASPAQATVLALLLARAGHARRAHWLWSAVRKTDPDPAATYSAYFFKYLVDALARGGDASTAREVNQCMLEAQRRSRELTTQKRV
eukprot:gene12969-20004_t